MGYIGNQNFDIIETHIGNVQGSDTEANILAKVPTDGDLWVGSDTGYLYLADGTQWHNIGQLRGDAGPQGSNGLDGVGIFSITRTDGDGSPGTVDTYTIVYSDGAESTYTVTNGADGKDITSIAKTATNGLEDTYTVTYSDATTFTYTVNNGKGIDTFRKLLVMGLLELQTSIL
jgi:hypothetical protein